ncbi:hypothetical protein PHJA_002125100 [Phtheirospermum japonicum]|uniref:Uncharacterized protein n=1 Tax=Phtheirospermum japonicum TaxID=374723 RepID=A0A830CJ63_9LAMI|nr:hypothetical protein PHJA_002125100 [Phtheirospermum japonicum]
MRGSVLLLFMRGGASVDPRRVLRPQRHLEEEEEEEFVEEEAEKFVGGKGESAEN